MSATGINFFFDLLNLRDDIFSIYYAFDSFSGANVIPSVSGGNAMHSGAVQGASAAFGLNDSSGVFNGFNYIVPQNVSALTGKNFSHFFVFERTGSATGNLFSSLNTVNSNSGYAIGINDANKLFFQYNTGAPAYYTFDQILANRNAVGVTLSNSILEFDWYNFNTRKFESEDFIIRDNLFFHSNDWKLGQGFSGTIDDWCYFNGNISKSNRERLFSGFYTLLDLSSGSSLYVTGYNRFQDGFLSGDYKVYVTGIHYYTGNLLYASSTIDGSSASLFGDFHDECGGVKSLYVSNGSTGILVGSRLLPLTGNLFLTSTVSGLASTELALSTRLEITGYLENPIPLYTGITGIQVLENVTLIDNCGNVNVAYTFNNLTGTVSGVDFLPQTGLVLSWNTDLYEFSSGQFAVTQAILNTPRIVDQRRIVPFGYNALTYLWSLDQDETLEFVAFTTSAQLLNVDKEAGFDTVRAASILDARYPSGVVNLFLNGLLQQESGRVLIGDVYNNRLEWQGDYYLDQNLAYGSGYQITDLAFYDYIANNTRGFRIVTGIGTYPLDIGPAANKNIYLNGQELYTGNYVLLGNNITLTGGLETSTGLLNFITKYPDESSLTGVKYIVTGRYLKGTSYMVQNGIRYSAEGFVEHSNLDKIGGNNIYAVDPSQIYGDEGTFWE